MKAEFRDSVREVLLEGLEKQKETSEGAQRWACGEQTWPGHLLHGSDEDKGETLLLAASLGAVLSHSVVSDSLRPHEREPTRLLCPWDSPGKNTGVGCHALLQGTFPTQGSNPGLLHGRRIFTV